MTARKEIRNELNKTSNDIGLIANRLTVAKSVINVKDAENFYNEHAKELNEWLDVSVEETELEVPELIVCERNSNDFKCFLVWSFYSQVANEMLDGMEL